MADKSSIEWTEATWNPVVGCSKVSPGCANCYAETLSLRFGWTPKPWLPEHSAENVILHPERLDQPFRWKRPRMVFVNSMSDLFHEEIDYGFIREVFNVMRRCDGGVVAATGKRTPAHTFQVLTKRPEHALKLWRSRKLGFDTWPPHIWLGVSIENARHTWRADVLREIPAAVRFISAEPLLGSLFLDEPTYDPPRAQDYEPRRDRRKPLDLSGIDWLIVGGESGGRDARPMHPEWARELRDACLTFAREGIGRVANLPPRPAFFFKQWGSWAPVIGHLDGLTGLHVLTTAGPEPWNGMQHGASTSWDTHAVSGYGELIVRYAGAGPKSGGRVLDGREWNEMPTTKGER